MEAFLSYLLPIHNSFNNLQNCDTTTTVFLLLLSLSYKARVDLPDTLYCCFHIPSILVFSPEKIIRKRKYIPIHDIPSQKK